MSPGLHHAGQLSHRCGLGIAVLHDVESARDVEGGVGEGKLQRRSADTSGLQAARATYHQYSRTFSEGDPP